MTEVSFKDYRRYDAQGNVVWDRRLGYITCENCGRECYVFPCRECGAGWGILERNPAAVGKEELN